MFLCNSCYSVRFSFEWSEIALGPTKSFQKSTEPNRSGKPTAFVILLGIHPQQITHTVRFELSVGTAHGMQVSCTTFLCERALKTDLVVFDTSVLVPLMFARQEKKTWVQPFPHPKLKDFVEFPLSPELNP